MIKNIKILIVDDHQMFLEGIHSLLSNEDDIEIVDIVSNGYKALEILQEEKVDVVITDLSMPEINGFDLIKKIQKSHPDISTLVLSMHSEPMTISKLIKQNVNGYLLKNAEKNELLKAIRMLAKGENYFSEEIKQKYLESSFNRKSSNEYVPELSRREKDVLKLILEEYTTKEIAEELHISQNTVESHRKNIFSKLNVKNIAGVVKYALENDLLG